MNPKDKRRAARRKQDAVLELYDVDGHFITGTGHLVDYSDVGIRFSSTKKLAPGEAVCARLRLINEKALEVSARVVWIREKPNMTLYGLAFDAVQKIRS